MKTYLDVAREGKTDWWRYLLSIVFILFMWFIIGSLPLIVAAFIVGFDGDPATGIGVEGLTGVDPLVNFALTIFTFLPFLFATLIAVRFIHQRPLRTLITPSDRIHWTRLLAGFGLWFILSAAISVVEALLYPGRYVLTLDIGRLIPFAIAILLLIPFQTSAEEFFFRAYVLQWAGLKINNRLTLSVISGLVFALPHILNPEVSVDFWPTMAYYFLFGTFAAWVTLKDNGLELALGMHAANNIYTGIFANYTVTALQTPAMFTIDKLDAVYNLVAPLIGMLVFYLVLFRPWQTHRENPLSA